MNKKQKIISIIFAIIIFFVGFVAFMDGKYFLAIMGAFVSFGLIFYGLSGKNTGNFPNQGRQGQGPFIKTGAFENIIAVIILFVIIAGVSWYIKARLEQNERIAQAQRDSEFKDYWHRNIEITEWSFGLEDSEISAYIKLSITNKGDRNVYNPTIIFRCFDKDRYLIKESVVFIKEEIPAKANKKIKKLLGSEQYPHGQKVVTGEIELLGITDNPNLLF